MAPKMKATKKPASSGRTTERTNKTTRQRSPATANRQAKGATGAKAVPGPSTMALKVGQKAPAFSLPNQDGKLTRLTDFTGKKVVLYCYPKDDTPGCTKESCAFRDVPEELHDCGAVVLGVSGDSVDSHKKFAQKFDLNFSLLSDDRKTMLRAYGVWKEKSMYGRKFMGIERTTFIINEQGKIAAVFQKVKVDGHVEEVLAELDVLP